jgi:protoheme IX farnesyltransferase
MMHQIQSISINIFQSFISDILQLTKFRLAISVVFSSIAGYFLAVENLNLTILSLLFLGGFSMVASSNIFNQWIEKEEDGLMFRTKNRPLPSGRMKDKTALFFGFVFLFVGIGFLYMINFRTVFFSVLSVFIYTCVYTPLKKITPLAVFIGAFPGAIPFMLGWVAATNKFGIEPGILFLIQFIWQFPHFWAIGWFMHDDYKKAGFRLLPSGKKDQATSFQIVFYTIWMILFSLIPATSYSGSLFLSFPAAILISFLGLIMLYFSISLMRLKTDKAAKKLIASSIVYISLLQLVFVIDKFI